MDKNDIRNDVIQTFGSIAKPVNEHPTKREEILTFRRGAFAVTFNMSSFWDAAKEEYGPMAASISIGNNKRYSSLPADPQILKEFADWVKTSLSEAVKDAPKRDGNRTDTDLEEAKRKIAKYKN